MMVGDDLRYTLVPDSHGQYELVGRMVDTHLDHTDVFLFLGDVLNGPDCARLIRLIRDLGERAITIVGNHEWVGRNALTESNDETVRIWQEEVWPGYEEATLASYGIRQTTNWVRNAQSLYQKMAETGDLEWLHSLPAYFETPRFIAVHAGPELTLPWKQQAENLDGLALAQQRLTSEPAQIFTGKLGTVHDVPLEVDERTFVTGHLHLTLRAEQRIAKRKVCLASPLNRGAPLYVWRSDEQRIYEQR